MDTDIASLIDGIMKSKRIPSATYRLQFNKEFTFQDAASLLDYLDDLGVTDLYASPILKARSSSTHGYDTCDFNQLNPNLGTVGDFEKLAGGLLERGMGLLLDMVPNHMGIGDPSNRWWMDVLGNGPHSEFAAFFDIDWDSPVPGLKGRVLLPVLGDHFGKLLEGGALKLAFQDGAFFIRYYDGLFPVAARSYPGLFQRLLEFLPVTLDLANETRLELERIVSNVDHHFEAGFHSLTPECKMDLALFFQRHPSAREALDEMLAELNGRAGEPASFDFLERLLDEQHYRLAFWRNGPRELNYRRFFDITDLVAVRMEREEVFAAAHQLILRLLAEGAATGMRIDHPDGLWDPKAYFDRLQEQYLVVKLRSLMPGGVDQGLLAREVKAWIARRKEKEGQGPLYLLVEKILSEGEELPRDWPVDGTTGYEFILALNNLFVNSANEEAFDRIYHEFTGLREGFDELVNQCKKRVLRLSFASELEALSGALKRLAAHSRHARDFTQDQLAEGLVELIAAFPVYRTYLTSGRATPTAQERSHIDLAITEAKERNQALASAGFFDFFQKLLLNASETGIEETDRTRFVIKFQQLCSPATAKGVEDTAFYRFNRLVSLNEVGGHPGTFGITLCEFHEQNRQRFEGWPHCLLATATHDNKRGEDLRARLHVLSEIPEEWRRAVMSWRDLNRDKKAIIQGRPAPDANDEYLLYQTLVGAWDDPATDSERAEFCDRVAAYMIKAVKEAKVKTSWTEPNAAYEEALKKFAHGLILPEKNPFIADFLTFQKRAAYFGRFNSLSQTLLKLTSPGVPDFYQGTEMWDLNLVDPDNRRPVDWAKRRELLAGIKGEAGSDPMPEHFARSLLESGWEGRIKLFLICRALHFRRKFPEMFSRGDYQALSVDGRKREHVCAFARNHGGRQAVVVAPRLVVGLVEGVERPPVGAEVWGDTWVSLPNETPGQDYYNVLTGEMHPVTGAAGQGGLALSLVLGRFPVALLEKVG